MRAQLQEFLIGDSLQIVFQPVVDIRTGCSVGAEALARFNAEPLRSPDLWFNDAWAVGLGLELEIAAIRRALEQLERFPKDAYMAVNAAPTTLYSDALFDAVRTLPLDRVVFELTEHARVENYDLLTQGIARLRAHGARLSVDDAGAGFASFQHVLRLRPDIIKLDRSLTAKIDTNPVRSALASALVTFAASLGARVCAEGIETPAELVTLQKLGIAYGQGYLLARPGPLPLPSLPPGLWPSRSAGSRESAGPLPSPAVRSPARLDSLARASLMDGDHEASFDRFTRLACILTNAPVALLSLVDDERQFFKSAIGLQEPWATLRETPLTHSFCQHAVTTRVPLVIEDARHHPLVSDNAAVQELGVIAYLGVPIITADGQALGALCAIDTAPRRWADEHVGALQDLTTMLVAEVELRKAHLLREERAQLERSILDRTGAAFALCNAEGRIEHASAALCSLLGYPEHELRERLLVELDAPERRVACTLLHNELLTGARSDATLESHLLRKDGLQVAVRTTISVIRDTKGRARFAMATVVPRAERLA